jgi:hypothetical protein
VLIRLPANGEGWIFLLNSVSFLAIIVGLFFVRPEYGPSTRASSLGFGIEFAEGTRYLRRQPGVGLLIVIAGAFGLLAFPALQQLPVVSQDLLHTAGDTRRS